MINKLSKNAVFKIGKVISVEGRSVKIEVEKTKNASNLLYDGEIIRNVAVNSYIKISKGFIDIIGKVDGEFIIEDKSFINKEYTNDNKKIKRILIVSLLGFLSNKGFKRGIKELPLLYNDCFLLNRKEFQSIHNIIKENDEPLLIGTLTHEKGQPVEIGINDLFASHIGIFGNTGSGKSYTLSKIYNELFKNFQDKDKFQENAKFILFDFNGEYYRNDKENNINSITNKKEVYNLSTRENIEDQLLFFEEDLLDNDLFSIIANATEKTQKPFISRALNFYKEVYRSTNPEDYFKDNVKEMVKNVYKMADKEKAFLLLDYLKEILRKYDKNNIENENALYSDVAFNNKLKTFYSTVNNIYFESNPEEISKTNLFKQVDNYKFPNDFISKVIHFLYLQLIYDVFANRAENKHIAPAINKLKSYRKDIDKVIKISTNQPNSTDQPETFWNKNFFCVINLNNTNTQIKKMIPLLVSYKLYREHKMNNKTKDKSLNFIIDEAHNILSHSSDRESETWKDYRLETFEEIIKEGRKFGVFLTIASQRPSDISPTIISQIHNFFLHRLINNNDIKAVEKTISYLDKLSFESLPILPTGTCIIAGLCVHIPIMVDVSLIEKKYAPDNETINLLNNWK